MLKMRGEWAGKLSEKWKMVLLVIGVLIFLQIMGTFSKEIFRILVVLHPLLLIAYAVLWLYVLIDILRHEFIGSRGIMWNRSCTDRFSNLIRKKTDSKRGLHRKPLFLGHRFEVTM